MTSIEPAGYSYAPDDMAEVCRLCKLERGEHKFSCGECGREYDPPLCANRDEFTPYDEELEREAAELAAHDQ